MECEEQSFNLSGCGVMAAALDLKSKELFVSCEFESHHPDHKIELVAKRSEHSQTRPMLMLSITVRRWQGIAPRKDSLFRVSVTWVGIQRLISCNEIVCIAYGFNCSSTLR